MKWKPIETAPKENGAPLLLGYRSKVPKGAQVVAVGYWLNDSWYNDYESWNEKFPAEYWCRIPELPK